MVEDDVVSALQRGDEAVFRAVVEQYHGALVRAASGFVRSRAVAEEVAQDTWLAVIRGVGRFEGRSSFKTWLFRILVNQARTRAVREARNVPVGAMTDEFEPSVPATRFQDADGRYPGHWRAAPTAWGQLPHDALTGDETQAVVATVITHPPEGQRQVITMRDIEGFTSTEVCALLEVSEVNQRVLLHRARSKVRAALELHLDTVAAS